MELATPNGRPIKFTPERIEQIRNLVERGLTREQIAELIGSTVGSLQVTCSHLGISLRMQTRSQKPMMMAPRPPISPPIVPSVEGNGRSNTTLSLLLQTKGRSREVRLNLTEQEITELILEAHFKGETLDQMFTRKVKRKD